MTTMVVIVALAWGGALWFVTRVFALAARWDAEHERTRDDQLDQELRDLIDEHGPP